LLREPDHALRPLHPAVIRSDLLQGHGKKTGAAVSLSERTTAPKRPEHAEAANGQSEAVLVVADNDEVRAMVIATISDLGGRALTAPNRLPHWTCCTATNASICCSA